MEGRRAIVTGAAQGIGRAIVAGLRGAGASVAAVDIDAAGLAGLDAETAALDVTDAAALGAFGITVNAVAPGFVRSNPTTERQWEALGPDGQERLVASIAMRRLGTPQDIAAAVLFLAGEEAGWITGQVLSVDGGR